MLSNADPQRTFFGLVGEDAAAGPLQRRAPQLPLRGHEREDQPRRRPAARGDRDAVRPRALPRRDHGVRRLRRRDGSRPGRGARRAPGGDPHIEVCIPTFHDPSLAPDGKHVVTIDVNSQPYTLAPTGTWDEIRDDVADRAIAKLEGYLPGLDRLDRRPPGAQPARPRAAARHHRRPRPARRHVLRPALQPAPGSRPRRLPDPGRDLYLCGAGTHPGGGVSGANGRNCAREVLRDARGPIEKLKASLSR